MTDKDEKEIARMARLWSICNALEDIETGCDGCAEKCTHYYHCEKLYKAGYRKIPEGAVVLTREEYSNLVLGAMNKVIEAGKQRFEQVRKETAKAVLQQLRANVRPLYPSVEVKLELIAKEYGVEV